MKQNCFHCGDEIIGKEINYDDKVFCCNGCKSVYELLSTNALNSYYSIEENAGAKPKTEQIGQFDFLDIPKIRKKHIDFEDENSIKTTLFLPQIHCSSCIYLLENIRKIEPKIKSCQVNFAKREAYFIIDKELQLSELAALLTKIGYQPNFGNRKETSKKQNYTYLYKLGVAGFAFGSIMLWSVPEHLGIENDNVDFRKLTSYLSLLISLPVLLYSANEYLISAYKALKHKSINLDVPISIGILSLYGQSATSILTNNGSGYMDSFAGFIFFLLIGKWFQSKTYQSLSFERDYTSYFPVTVYRKKNETEEEIIEIEEIEIGDTITIRNQEIIPCDSHLLSDEVEIDYSFVTGESIPIKKKKGDFIYAGGKLIGQKSELLVEKKSNRSHLTQLWNEATSHDHKTSDVTSDKFSIYFLIGLLIIAFGAGIFWFVFDSSRTVEIIVSVLIVACPCALALSKPFAYGSIMRALGRKKIYLKNVEVIPKLNETTDLIFDKTGTLTTGSGGKILYNGKEFSKDQKEAILVLANSSGHPLSKSIVNYLKGLEVQSNKELINFNEIEGNGIVGTIEGNIYKIGSYKFITGENAQIKNETSSYISINDEVWGEFTFESEFRDGIFNLLKNLGEKYNIHILSGDKNKDENYIIEQVPTIKSLHFNQSPIDKLNFVQQLQNDNKKTLMIGDGLNDAGALDKANCGIAISEDAFRFTPGSDAILEANELKNLDKLLKISAFSKKILRTCYIFSLIYNIIGLSFALTGFLTPLVAAILMPISSVSVVLISTFLARIKH